MKCPYAFVIDPLGKDLGRYYHQEYVSDSLNMRAGVVVPCGKCVICRLNRAAEWSTRLVHELQYHDDACFVTLTYNDDHLPWCDDGYTLDKRDPQKFLKRLRRRVNRKIKYFLCGEYGSETQRPHYHAIIFGWRPALDTLIPLPNDMFSSSELLDYWQYGNVQVSAACNQSIYYTTGYMIKDVIRKETKYDTRQNAYLACSHYIGYNYLQSNADDISCFKISAEGKRTAVPRYYIKHLKKSGREMDKSLIKHQTRDKELAFMRKKVGKKLVNPGDMEYDYIMECIMSARKQNERIVQNKIDRIRSRKRL